MGPPTDLVPGPCALCRRLGNSVVTDCPGYTTEEDLDRENAAQKGNGKKAPRNCLLRHLASWSKKKGRKQHEPHKTNRHRLGALTAYDITGDRLYSITEGYARMLCRGITNCADLPRKGDTNDRP